MENGVWQRFDNGVRRLVPALLCLMFVVIGVVPLPVPGLASVVPMLALAAVFFWAVHAPRLLPPWAVFLIGFVHDILSGGALGRGTVVLLVVYAVVASQRRFFHDKGFAEVWAGFLLVAAAAATLSWLLAMAASGALMDPRAAVVQLVLTLAAYPIVTWVLHGAQRLLPAEG